MLVSKDPFWVVNIWTVTTTDKIKQGSTTI